MLNINAPVLGAIWAQTDKGVIGRNGTISWHIPEDLKHFQQTTAGKPVIMGRRTWDSLPDAYKPLPGRANIIVSRSVNGIEHRNGCTWVSTLDVALEEAYRAVVNQENTRESVAVESDKLTSGKPERGTDSTESEEEVATELVEPEPTHADVWIIGGGALYSEALTRNNLPRYKHVCVIERTILTTIDGTVIPGDTKAPTLTGDAKGNNDTVHPTQTMWETVSEQPLRVSKSGYLLDEHGEMCPAVYTFQTLEKVCAI